MEDLLMNALMGAIGSSPVALVLVWRLKVADARAEAMEARITKLVDDHTTFFTNAFGKKVK